MRVITVTKPMDEYEALFPAECEAGEVTVTPAAITAAQEAAGTDALPEWHTPAVFSVRYGSSYVATAKFADVHVRFLMNEGDFREEDIKE